MDGSEKSTKTPVEIPHEPLEVTEGGRAGSGHDWLARQEALAHEAGGVQHLQTCKPTYSLSACQVTPVSVTTKELPTADTAANWTAD